MPRRTGRVRGRGGVRKVTIPNLSGLTRTQAQSLLSSLGLSYIESTSDTSDSNLTNYIQSQTVSSGSTVTIGSAIPFSYYTYVNPITYTYGPCEAYGSPISNLGNSTGCSGTFYQERTTYRYNTRKKIYANGVWDGSSYSTDGCGTTDVLVATSSNQIDGLCGYSAPPPACTISSYSGWSYSNITWSGSCPSGTESGTASSRSRTDNCGNTYNESGSYAVTRSCTPPTTITYGACEIYGSSTGTGADGTQCSGTAYQTWQDYYYAQREKIYVNGSWDGSSYRYGSCSTATQREVTGTYYIDGLCGYTAPPTTTTWYCTESYNGGGVGNCGYSTSTFNNSASGSGYSRSCSTSGYPSCQSTNPVTPPSCISYKYQCKSYDVTNPASNNYFQCYSVGECAANNNSDGSRTQCCATYA